jgi:hypothetical protein
MDWRPGLAPVFPQLSESLQVPVGSADEVSSFLVGEIQKIAAPESTGLLLSGGIDSAIIAALLPEGSHTFTIRFVADGAIDEVSAAREYAERMKLVHHVIDVTWDDHISLGDELMQAKKAPLHAVEVGLCKAARTATDLGIKTLLTGNGADSTFGGMDKLLSVDWSFDAFVDRYTFINPATVLINPVDITGTYEPYRIGKNGIDYIRFLKSVHGLGIVQAFDNALTVGGCTMIQPYEQLKLDGTLDLKRIRAGESKYILRKVFVDLYPNMNAPEKIPFARPMEQWLADWCGPTRKEFMSNLDMQSFTGDQRWLLFCLERFMNLMDAQ